MRLLVWALLVIPGAAQAIPAFARQQHTSCGTCHARAFPALNPYGRFFQENGFQLPEGAERPAPVQPLPAPGTIADRLELWRELPVTLRAQSSVVAALESQRANRNPLDFQMLENLAVAGGGPVFKDLSFFAAGSLAPRAGLHHGAVGFHNLLGEGRLNLRAGQFMLLNFLQPEHRSLTRLGNVGATVRVGLNPTALDSSQLGFDLYGRLLARRLFWEVALVQGAQGANGLTDLDGNKDLFAQLQLTVLEEQTLGILGYWGRTQLTDRARGTVVRFSDPFGIAGVNAEAHLGPLSFFGYALYGHHANPTGVGQTVDYWSFRADATAGITRSLLAIIRYDRILSNSSAPLEKELLTAHLSYLLVAKLKLSAEYVADLGDFSQSSVFFRLDLTL